MDDDELDITVHKLLLNSEDASQLPSQSVLADATRFVISTTREIRWRTPLPVDLSLFSTRGPCFQYHRLPDDQAIRKLLPPRSPNALKEWDEDIAVADNEPWSLKDLLDFDHSHLHYLLDARQAGSSPPTPVLSAGGRYQPPATNIKKRASSDSHFPHRLPKRLKLDMSPLRGVLPAPHFYPPQLTNNHDFSSLIHSATWPTTDGPSPIHPFTRDSCEKYLEDQYARLAWIVPIRGCLEWDGATSASILSNLEDTDSPVELECLPTPRIEGSREIFWTTDALIQLWDVLKSLREVGNLGALSLSFYAVPSASTAGSMEQCSYFGSHKQTTPSRSNPPLSPSPHPAASPSGSTPIRSPLRGVDHFKVYHDAPYTKVVRSALHGWSYRKGDRKIRLLKGARLVLVDERSKGLLLC